MPLPPSEVIASLLTLTTVACAVAWLSCNGLPPLWSGLVAVGVCFSVLRFIASGFVSPSPIAIVDLFYTALPGTVSKSYSAVLATGGTTPFSALEAKRPLEGRVHLVTGATPGSIGFWTAVLLCRLGANVVVTCRTRTMAAAAASGVLVAAKLGLRPGAKCGAVTPVDLDLTSHASVAALPTTLATKGIHSLHCVVHNAGVLVTQQTRTSESQGEPQVMCNVVGTIHVADTLTPLLMRTAGVEGCHTKHVFLSSIKHRDVKIAAHHPEAAEEVERMLLRCIPSVRREIGTARDQQANLPSGFACYDLSKLGVIAAAARLSRELAGTGVCCTSLHPGCALTDITRDMPRWIRIIAKTVGPFVASVLMKSSLEASYTTVAACLDDRLTPPLYWMDGRPATPSPLGLNPAVGNVVVKLSRAETTRQCAAV